MGACSAKMEAKFKMEGLLEIDDIRTVFTDIHLLGDGGSSNVFRVTRRKDMSKCALKRMSKKTDANHDFFLSECTILKQLHHENIIQFEDAYMDSKNFYIATHLCEGGDLLSHIRHCYKDGTNAFTECYVASLVDQIASAVQHCHSLDIVHRDIKPENFVFMSKRKGSKLVLLDFGIAIKAEKDEEYEDLVGTPYYIAPEYLIQPSRTMEELKAADVWSIGVIAFVLCTGRPPFQAKTNEEVFLKIIGKPLKFPRKAKLSSVAKGFLKNLLQKVSKLRPSASQIREHPWLSGDASNQTLDVLGGLVSFSIKNKFRKVVNHVVKQHMSDRNWHEMFDGIDTDGDGTIDLEELKMFLLRMGYAKFQVEEKANEIMKKLDRDGDGDVDLKEFHAAWAQFQLSQDDRMLHELFNVFDADGDGEITLDEIRALLGDDEDTYKAFKSFDTNNDGGVNFEEFSNALTDMGILDRENNNFGLFQRCTHDSDNEEIDEAEMMHPEIANNLKKANKQFESEV